MARQAQLTQLTLGGFQVFEEPVTIPFEKLTLLFGPNSAGKSSIADGIAALHELCELFAPNDVAWGSTVADDLVEPGKILTRHWRRTPDSPSGRSPRLLLGADVMTPPENWAEAALAEFGEGTETESGKLLPAKDRFEAPFRAIFPLTCSPF